MGLDTHGGFLMGLRDAGRKGIHRTFIVDRTPSFQSAISGPETTQFDVAPRARVTRARGGESVTVRS